MNWINSEQDGGNNAILFEPSPDGEIVNLRSFTQYYGHIVT